MVTYITTQSSIAIVSYKKFVRSVFMEDTLWDVLIVQSSLLQRRKAVALCHGKWWCLSPRSMHRGTHIVLCKQSLFVPSEARFYSGSIEISVGAVVVVVTEVVTVHGHFWTSRCSGSILQLFGFKLSVRASRVAKIL